MKSGDHEFSLNIQYIANPIRNKCDSGLFTTKYVMSDVLSRTISQAPALAINLQTQLNIVENLCDKTFHILFVDDFNERFERNEYYGYKGQFNELTSVYK